MAHTIRSIAILGAGKLGITLAQLAINAGYHVTVAGSESPEKIRLAVEVLAPGAVAMPAKDAVKSADAVILALPLGKFRTIPKVELTSKLVIDAMNYWWEIDGSRDGILDADMSSSEAVQEYLNDSRVVKALNHIGYHDLHDHHKPKGADNRRAVAIAGNTAADVEAVRELVDNLGFDPLVIGDLSSGVNLEPGHPAFGASVGIRELGGLLNTLFSSS